ncbi:MAG: hypothetical protein CVU90_02025 [Firmicutes bacterium HGW-Firmicutes-15]|nr:MAG: hypothetical protein CVU90_02025 [Firmicutes bacterium HGW-Firmicutes-15]
MPEIKVLARDMNVFIKVATVWTEIKELNTVTFGSSKNDADTTTFTDGGWNTHIVTSRGRTCKLEGFYVIDEVTKARNPGQAAVDALNNAIGYASLGEFKVVFPDDTNKTFLASVNLIDLGGGNDDGLPWGAELTVSGEVTDGSESDVVVTGVTLNKTTSTLAVGANETLLATVAPVNATNKNVTFISSNPAKATVDGVGKVVAVAAGVVTITVTTDEGHFTADCVYTVTA